MLKEQEDFLKRLEANHKGKCVLRYFTAGRSHLDFIVVVPYKLRAKAQKLFSEVMAHLHETNYLGYPEVIEKTLDTLNVEYDLLFYWYSGDSDDIEEQINKSDEAWSETFKQLWALKKKYKFYMRVHVLLSN